MALAPIGRGRGKNKYFARYTNLFKAFSFHK